MVISQFPAQFGKYILLDRINAGGMAEVFRAKVTGVEQFERLVAIKCMLPSLLADDHFITMFIDEAKLASQLTHANIVQIYELGRIAERLYIAMELVNGRDLRHILRAARANQLPIPIGFATYVIAKAAEGLDFAHRKVGIDGTPLQLVHRDVSPQNILVSYDGEVKVVDFGIAKAEARNTETQAGVLKGKFAYMAPEQVAGKNIDRRADIFALGAVLYEVATGKRLFSGDNDLSLLEKVKDANLPDLATVLPEGSKELDPILRKALARDPNQRYRHASELAEALEPLLIEDRSIFGYKRAAQFMRALYADEVVKLAEQLKRYSEITPESCVISLGPSEPDKTDSERVYESAFERGEGTDNHTAVAPIPTPTPTPTSRATRAQAPARSTQPLSGVEMKPLKSARRQAAAAAPRTTKPKVDVHRRSRKLRHLWLVLMMSVTVTATLVVIVSLRTRSDGAPVLRDAGGKGLLDWIPLQQKASEQPPAPPNEDVDDDPAHPKYGWVAFKLVGVERAHVFIDGKEVMPLPPVLRLRVGVHDVRVVEDIHGYPAGHSRTTSITVTSRTSRKAPAKINLWNEG